MSGAGPVARHRALEALWSTPPGLGRLSAVNHSIVGLRFIVTGFFFFLVGGVLAMLIRAQLATPQSAFMEAGIYNQVFTMHGTVMMFLFVIPMIEGAALYLLPKLLGARDLAFPRLSAFGYWCYLGGGTILLVALAVGAAPDSGWFMYTPLSSKPWSPGINADVWLLGVTFVEVSAVCAAVELLATILKVRTAGMALNRMPLFVWYIWVTAGMMLVAFPPLILGSVLLEIERAFDWPFFDPARGGDPILWQHLFWLFGHPEVYIIFVPAAGVVSTLVPVFAGRPIVGYTWIVVSIIALAFLSLGLWVHHMFAVGIPHLALSFFSAASMLVAIPTAVQFFAWIATLLKGRPRLELPMLWLFGFVFIFVLGGLTGVMVAVVPFDWQVHDTHFVVAHLHYVLIGGFVFPMIAGVYYWLPLVTGRMPVMLLSHAAFWFTLIGFNLTFFMMHFTGLLGMTRRVYTYGPEDGWTELNILSSIGGFVMAIGFAAFLLDVILQIRMGRRAPRNPWNAGTLEWAMATPSPNYNIAAQPEVAGREPLHDDPALPGRLAAGDGYAAVPRGWMETLSVHMLNGRPDAVIVLPNPSFVPLYTAMATGAFFLSFLFQVYGAAWFAAAAVLACAIWWLWESGLKEDLAPLPIGRGESVPIHAMTNRPPTYWGLVFTLGADGSFFASLVFGYLFLWVIAPNWPPPAFIAPDWISPVIGIAALLGGFGSAVLARAANLRNDAAGRGRWLLVAVLCGLVAAGAFLAAPLLLLPDPSSHAYAAASAVLALYGVLHAFLGAVFAAYAYARARAGYVSAVRRVELTATAVWWGYTAATGAAAMLLLHLMPFGAMP